MRTFAGTFLICVLSATGAQALDSCFHSAGLKYNIDPLLLKAISIVESNLDMGAHNKNNNGTSDLCAMQINTVHMDRLKTWGISERVLTTDECACVETGAFILAENIKILGPTWKAVGAYNAGRNGKLRVAKQYALKVRRIYVKLRESTK